MTMDKFANAIVTLNSVTNGRDKQFRLFQYLSRLVWASVSHVQAIDKMKRLEEAMSTSRKLLQLGRFIDVIISARASIHLDDKVLNLTLTLSKVSTALYILTDNIIWAARIGVINVDRVQWFKTSMRFWLYSIIMNLLRDMYEIQKMMEKSLVSRVQSAFQQSINPEPQTPEEETLKSAKRLGLKLLANRPVSIDLVKNFCDFWIPLNSLNHVSLSPRTIGLLGTVSSVCALLQLSDPSFRLKPS